MMRFPMKIRLAVLAAALLLAAGVVSAADNKLMHCFYFTPIAEATATDWEAFHKATDELPSKIPGLSRVWYGKLLRQFPQYNPDKDARAKLTAGEKSATGEVTVRVREYGVCMEMADENALKIYAAHPAHREWEKVYAKVRQPGTMTFDIVGK